MNQDHSPINQKAKDHKPQIVASNKNSDIPKLIKLGRDRHDADLDLKKHKSSPGRDENDGLDRHYE